MEGSPSQYGWQYEVVMEREDTPTIEQPTTERAKPGRKPAIKEPQI